MRERDIVMGNYFGSKATSGLCQAIIALMPPHDTYIETHLGGGAIMLRKPPALRNIGVDLDPASLARFECHYPVEKVHGCAHQFLREFSFHGRELVYCDPPYLHHTRSSKRRYRFEYTEQDHVQLLKLLTELDCAVMLSGYPSALYGHCSASPTNSIRGILCAPAVKRINCAADPPACRAC